MGRSVRIFGLRMDRRMEHHPMTHIKAIGGKYRCQRR
jgi:hypothetical protein